MTTSLTQSSDLGPLARIRVLDLTRVLAGPLCTMILGDLGADVIKIERPGVGDDTRGWGPPFDAEGRSAYYLSVNRNKLGVAADLGSPDGRELVLRLAAGADVVVDNFLPGALGRLGIDAAALLAANPRLVWCTITGFGAGSTRPGYDFAVQAECGWMAITGDPDGDPMKVGVALADVIAGKDAAIAILAALVRRGSASSSAGPGARHLVISLADSARAVLVNVAQSALVSGRDAKRWGNAHPNLVPYQLFHARDRAIVIAVGSDAQWSRCAAALGLHDLAREPALATNAGRVAARDRIVDAIAAAVAPRDAAEIGASLSRAGVPTGTVRPILEVVREAGGSPLTGMPSSVGGAIRLPPPALDEHGPAVRAHGWGAVAVANGR